MGECCVSEDTMDETGDLVIPRRRRNCMHNEDTMGRTIVIHHHARTTLPYVGLQIWKASFLLGDFLLHKMQTTAELDDVIALELGAGTGLLGILLAAKARLVFLTDFDVDVLDNCHRNALLNSRKSKRIASALQIRQLDWKEPWPPNAGCSNVETSVDNQSLLVCLLPSVYGDYSSHQRNHETRFSRPETRNGWNGRNISPASLYSWCNEDLEELENLKIMFAADVIYSDSLTDAFFSLLRKLMPIGSQRLLWLAIEKRFNFSISELDVVAHGYRHFLSFFDNRTDGLTLQDLQGCKTFAGKKLQLNQVPQYIQEYDRTKDLELWEIWRT
ncbi:hypothetical protein GOP47_0024607 [Adiantum capillus-veneris]|uniref:Methyltransferase-like protein 22 n=1 Tax=Adiantum capillus-veneris TaxID=13818 RepID=A0A9D4Z4I6_ADICA|nr:hypothetical protein GOP47_0024607 [Adiantum capillus-veneris]